MGTLKQNKHVYWSFLRDHDEYMSVICDVFHACICLEFELNEPSEGEALVVRLSEKLVALWISLCEITNFEEEDRKI